MRHARVVVEEETVGSIDAGLLVYLGVGADDQESDLEYVSRKCAELRIFEDADGRMNRSVAEVGGSALVVSQFTLYGDTRKGRRPSFIAAMAPERAAPMIDRFVATLRDRGLNVATGRFGADMQVHSVNDGPVTILIDSHKGP